jgi:hypothetical protein
MGICTLASTPESGPRTRRSLALTTTTITRRGLTQQQQQHQQQQASSPPASSSAPSLGGITIDNSTLWQAPLVSNPAGVAKTITSLQLITQHLHAKAVHAVKHQCCQVVLHVVT